MPPNATVKILSDQDACILHLFPSLLSADAPASLTIQVVTEISRRVIHAFLDSHDLSASAQITLVPVLRAALPMYVAASPLFPNSGTSLVRCWKDKSMHGSRSVQVEWLGAHPAKMAVPEHSGGNGKEKHLIILDTILATGDTMLKLCDELSDTLDLETHVTVLCCYASPQAVAAVADHPIVRSIFVAHLADIVDEHGYLVPSTNGDMGDKLFGKKVDRRSL